MRVLISSIPATGHFNSIIPMARATAAAGHEVAICCADAFADEVRSYGFEHLQGGAESLAELSDGAPPLGDPARGRFIQRQVFAGRATQRMIPDMVRHVGAWKPDVLVHENAEFAASLVAEKLGLPHASIGTGAWSSRGDRRELFAARCRLVARRSACSRIPTPR